MWNVLCFYIDLIWFSGITTQLPFLPFHHLRARTLFPSCANIFNNHPTFSSLATQKTQENTLAHCQGEDTSLNAGISGGKIS